MSISKWIENNTKNLSGKRVVISGSTGGLGRELCSYLAYLGAELVLLDRNSEKSHKLAAEIKSRFNDVSISCICADMSDISSVKIAADTLSGMNIDYLILNAGAYSIPRHTCDTGYDNVFQINFVSPYYLARELLPSIEKRGGKIVAVGSIAHNYSKIDENDIDFSTRKPASKVYGNAKRYLTYGLFALNSDNISVAHPGISFTGITNHYPKLIFALIKHPMKIIFPHPRVACLSVLYALFAKCKFGEWVGPAILDIWGMPRVKKLHTASKEEMEKIAVIADEIYKNVNKK